MLKNINNYKGVDRCFFVEDVVFDGVFRYI